MVFYSDSIGYSLVSVIKFIEAFLSRVNVCEYKKIKKYLNPEDNQKIEIAFMEMEIKILNHL